MIKYGHREEAIPDYSVDKFEEYVAETISMESETRATEMIDLQLAVASLFHKDNSKNFKEHVQGLLKG